MKKKLFIIVGAIVLVIASGIGIYQSNAANQNPKLSIEDVKDRVIAQYPGEITEVEFDREHNREIYEVELVYEGMEYEFKIDANTGEVIKLKEKPIHGKNNENSEKNQGKERLVIKENDTNDDEVKQKESAKENKDNGQYRQQNEKQKKKSSKEKIDKTVIDMKKAIQIALNEFPGTVYEAEIDREDGRLVYEIEIYDNGEKAELDIDAYTGEITSIEIKKKNKKIIASAKAVITMEKAIQIALNEFPGTVYEAELDREDGRLIYEIEIKANGEEADFDIDAFTGEIISIEIEEDD